MKVIKDPEDKPTIEVDNVRPRHTIIVRFKCNRLWYALMQFPEGNWYCVTQGSKGEFVKLRQAYPTLKGAVRSLLAEEQEVHAFESKLEAIEHIYLESQ